MNLVHFVFVLGILAMYPLSQLYVRLPSLPSHFPYLHSLSHLSLSIFWESASFQDRSHHLRYYLVLTSPLAAIVFRSVCWFNFEVLAPSSPKSWCVPLYSTV